MRDRGVTARMFPNLSQDIERYIHHEGLNESGLLKRIFVLALNQGLLATMVHRWGVPVRKIPVSIIRKPLLAIWFFQKKLIEIIFSIHISGAAELGPGFYIGHFGCFINGRFGKNCSVSQNVTIGSAGRGKKGVPTIGDNVYFGAGSMAFGAITIGDNVNIGACALVNKNLPSNCTAVGVPARIISNREATPKPFQRILFGAGAAVINAPPSNYMPAGMPARFSSKEEAVQTCPRSGL